MKNCRAATISLVCRGGVAPPALCGFIPKQHRAAKDVVPYGFDVILCKDNSRVVRQNLSSAFSFDTKGAKEKAIKKKTPFLEGYAPSTARAFFKKLGKNFQYVGRC